MTEEKTSVLLEELWNSIEEIKKVLTRETDFNELTYRQLHYLERIDQMRNPSLSELAKDLGLTKPSVSVALNRLVEKGFIRRVRSDKDRRSAHIHLTGKGRYLQDLHIEWHNKADEQLKAFLSMQEQTAFKEMLQKINRGMVLSGQNPQNK